MRYFLPSSLLLLLILIGASGPGHAAKAPAPPRFAHASLAAYPGAVISLKDPKSGFTFYVESDGRRLVALDRDGGLAWGIDVLEETKIKPFLGAPVIRKLGLEEKTNKLWVICGKNDTFIVEPSSGKVTYFGRD